MVILYNMVQLYHSDKCTYNSGNHCNMCGEDVIIFQILTSTHKSYLARLMVNYFVLLLKPKELLTFCLSLGPMSTNQICSQMQVLSKNDLKTYFTQI